MLALSRSTLRHFNLAQRGHYRSRSHEVLESEIQGAVDDRALCAVVGAFGSGKSTLVSGALRQAKDAGRPLNVVRVQDPNRENQKISHVMNAAIYDLSIDNPRRDAEARARQFIRIVGERVVRQRERVVIVVENAHRLHPRTLMAIKDSREMGFADTDGPLFSVLLVGQGRLREMLERQPEIGHRTTRVELTEEAGWMTHAERGAYIEAVYPGVVEPATVERLASTHTTPLALDAAVSQAMRDAQRAGFDRVDERTVSLALQDLVDVVDASYAEIARVAGMPKSTVHNVIKAGDADTRSPAVRAAIAKIIAAQGGDATSLKAA